MAAGAARGSGRLGYFYPTATLVRVSSAFLVPPQISDSRRQQLGVIPEESDARVARLAQQAADLTGLVAMVNRQTPNNPATRVYDPLGLIADFAIAVVRQAEARPDLKNLPRPLVMPLRQMPPSPPLARPISALRRSPICAITRLALRSVSPLLLLGRVARLAPRTDAAGLPLVSAELGQRLLDPATAALLLNRMGFGHDSHLSLRWGCG
jgi:hypothetical protein